LHIHYPTEFAWKVESEFEKGTVVSLALPCYPPAVKT